MRLSALDTALIATIYDPPRARRPWILKDVLPEGATRYYSLARWALVDALRACGVAFGDRVLLPAMICKEVLASISVLGATPAFYPVSRQLRASFTAGAMSPAKAIVAVNYFGFPQELEVFRQYCARTGAALIEDNAHGLLSRDGNGQLLGSRGDAGLFSFRKTIAVPDGGALVLNGQRDMPSSVDAPAVNANGGGYRLKQAFRRVSRGLGPARTLKTIGAVRQMRQSFTGEAVPRSAADAETRIPLAPNPRALISSRLRVADPELESQRRRALYDLAGQIVETMGASPVFPQLPQNVAPYGFPVFASTARAPGIVADLARHGLPLTQWPDLPASVAPSAAVHYRELFVVPFLW